MQSVVSFRLYLVLCSRYWILILLMKKAGLRTVRCWWGGRRSLSTLLPQPSVAPRTQRACSTPVSPHWGRRAQEGGQRARNSSRFVFKNCLGQKWRRRESDQMTFIKSLSRLPSLFENSLRVRVAGTQLCPAIFPALLVSRCVTRRGAPPSSSCGSLGVYITCFSLLSFLFLSSKIQHGPQCRNSYFNKTPSSLAARDGLSHFSAVPMSSLINQWLPQ